MYKIPTYEEAKRMVAENPEMCFFETKHNIDGFDISIFSYKLAWYDNFKHPLKDSDLTANEMRGLTFIIKDGIVIARHIMLTKFWNINQVEDSQYNILKHKKIKSVYRKEDGTLCTFIRLPNGKTYPKTKGSFGWQYASSQRYKDDNKIEVITEIYNTNSDIKTFVDYCMDNNIVPLFEYVSFQNKVVLGYDKTELRLLRLRNNDTGEYYDLEDYKHLTCNIITPTKYDYTLDELLFLQKTAENEEGWVVTFDDETMNKVKTLHYFALHRLITEELYREDYIIDLILNEKIDDVIGQVPLEHTETHEFIKDIEHTLTSYIDRTTKEIKILASNFNNDFKEFNTKYSKDPLYHFTVRYLRGTDIFEILKSWILLKTFRLEEARTWLKSNGYVKKVK